MLVCCLPVELKNRELNGRLLLAAALAARGVGALLGSKRAVRDALRRFPHTAVFDKGLVPEAHFYEKLKAIGTAVLSLDEEGGGFSEKTLEDFVLPRYGPEATPFVDLFFMWGPAQARRVIEAYPAASEEKVIISGNPRFDLLREPYSAFHAPEIESIRNRYGRFVLVNTNFSWANHFLGYRKGILGLEGWSEAQARGPYTYFKEVLARFVGAVERIAQSFPSLNVVVRPHPAEDTSTYEKAFADRRNVFVVYEGNVQKWILAAAALIHHDCSTGIEAVIAERPTFSYSPISDERYVQDLAVAVSELATSENELLRQVEEYVIGDRTVPTTVHEERTRLITRWLAYDRGPAAETIARSVVNHRDRLIASSQPTGGGTDQSAPSEGSPLGRLVGKLQSRFADRQMHRLTQKKMPGISIEEVEGKLSRLRDVAPGFAEVRAEKIAKDGFLFTRG